ncbi:hypothetical protein [Pseudaquabacterium rugosum]|uniref:Uncharacterized protein n=1 Tax=Pseudaquabacterium rugosum TaxID=2984194 RepID=A0ABU9BBD8_9BURK
MTLIPAVRLIPLLVAAACSPMAGAATLLTGGQTTLQTDGWEVTRSERGGSVRCTATLASDHGAELDAEGLRVKVAEAPQWIAWQFDDGPWLPRRNAGPMEQRLREAVLSGAELEQARRAQRVRLQTGSIKRGVDTQRLDLTGLATVEAHLRAGCPRPTLPVTAATAAGTGIPASTATTTAATVATSSGAGLTAATGIATPPSIAAPAAAAAAPAAAADLCSDALKTRLRSVGVSLAQITQACRP